MSSEHPPGNSRRELYRDPSRGKIFGVCAGIADYFGLEVWVVRIITITALIFFQFPIFIAYIIAYLVLEPKAGTTKFERFKGFRKRSRGQFGYSSDDTKGKTTTASVKEVWKKGRIPGQTLKKLNGKFRSLEKRLQNMESYVTSKQFELRKEFENL